MVVFRQEVVENVIEILLHLDSQVVSLMLLFAICKDVVKYELDFIKNFFDKLVLSFVVLPSDEIQVGWFLYKLFVIFPRESFMCDWFTENAGLFISKKSLYYLDEFFVMITRDRRLGGNHCSKHVWKIFCLLKNSDDYIMTIF